MKKGKPILRAKDKKFARQVALTGDKRGALIEAKLAGNAKWPMALDKAADKKLANKAVVTEIMKVWDQQGLTLEVAAAKHFQILTGHKTKPGDVLKAVDMVYKGRRVPGFSDAADKPMQKTILEIFIETRAERGLPMPAEVIEIMGEEVPPTPT